MLGVATAITMGRFNFYQLHQAGAAAFLIIPLWDMAPLPPRSRWPSIGEKSRSSIAA